MKGLLGTVRNAHYIYNVFYYIIYARDMYSEYYYDTSVYTFICCTNSKMSKLISRKRSGIFLQHARKLVARYIQYGFSNGSTHSHQHAAVHPIKPQLRKEPISSCPIVFPPPQPVGMVHVRSRVRSCRVENVNSTTSVEPSLRFE
jgi:hypothetical protein